MPWSKFPLVLRESAVPDVMWGPKGDRLLLCVYGYKDIPCASYSLTTRQLKYYDQPVGPFCFEACLGLSPCQSDNAGFLAARKDLKTDEYLLGPLPGTDIVLATWDGQILEIETDAESELSEDELLHAVIGSQVPFEARWSGKVAVLSSCDAEVRIDTGKGTTSRVRRTRWRASVGTNASSSLSSSMRSQAGKGASSYCLRRRNGNMPVERRARASFVLGTTRNNLANMHGTKRTQETSRILSVRRSRTLLGCMTCTGTYGSGARIGPIATTMRNRRRTILVVLQRARSACFAAGAGTTTAGAAGRRAAATGSPYSGTATWAYVSPEFRPTRQVTNWGFYSISD